MSHIAEFPNVGRVAEDPLITLANKAAQLCDRAAPEPFHSALLVGINELDEALRFHWILSRGGWYRIGGVVDADGRRIADNLEQWVRAKQAEFDDDLDAFIEAYGERGYRVTHLEGESHYFTAPTGKGAAQFLQLEVEDVQEVPVRPLLAAGWEPDDWEELIEPMEPVNDPDARSPFPRRYLFRRLLPIDEFLRTLPEYAPSRADVRRMLRDWDRSSAGKLERFCDHWAIGIRDAGTPDGAPQARVLTASGHPLGCECGRAEAWAEGELAACTHNFDHAAGYPFAWYFHMVAGMKVGTACALAVMDEHNGDYAYLPDRDHLILEDWVNAPYRA